MATTIGAQDLGQDENNQNGNGANGVNQAGQTSNTNTANQAGQAPVQSQSGAASTNPSAQGGQSTGSNNTPSAGQNSTTAGGNNVYNPNKQQGSGYTNIQKVLNANQGNQLSSAVGNNLQNTETSAQSNLANSQNQFNQQTQANQANTQGNQQLAQNVLADPSSYTNQSNNPANAQQGSQFTNLLSGQYQGPTSLNNATNIQNQAANVAQQGQALGTSGGRIGLLQQMVGNPQYTSGDANLDSLLLGQSSSPQLQQAKQQALTLQGQVGNAVTGAAAQGQQQQAQAQQFGKALQGQLGSDITSQTAAIQNQATQNQTANNAQYQKAISDLQSGNVNQQEANALGLTQGENVYNLLNGNNANSFLQENPNQANVANTATQQQYAQMQALQQLGGQYINQPAQQALQNFQSPSQAGTYATQQNLVGNQPAFNTALTNANTNIQGILANPQAQQQNAQAMQNILGQYGINPGEGSIAQSFNWIKAQQALANAGDAGAMGGNEIQDVNWVGQNLANTNAALAAAQGQVQSQYGPGQMINIQNPSTPPSGGTVTDIPVSPSSQYPTIAGANS